MTLVQDYDCEKEDSEKSDEKNENDETKDFSEYLFHKNNFVVFLYGLSFSKNDKLLFIPSNYSKKIHPPPERQVV